MQPERSIGFCQLGSNDCARDTQDASAKLHQLIIANPIDEPLDSPVPLGTPCHKWIVHGNLPP
jgi:hypothetical protein